MKAEPRFHNAPHFKNFWEKGNGKELLDWADVTPDLGNFEKYASLYHEVDNLSDDLVKETYLKLPYPEASALIKKYSKSKISENADEPESLKRFFLQMQEVPKWFDEDLANSGARLCMRSGTNALIILRDFVLMGGYDYAYLNKPLIFTGALKRGAVKRLKDTLEFWVHVTREDALKVNSEAYQLIIRTRLMHSYARLKIKEKGKIWDYEIWGEPINFWDMIATYTGFSLVLMQGLKKLGVKISEKEEAGVFHLWKYIGYLLGIPKQFLPENRQQAVEQLYLWSTLQDQGDEDSVQLAQALLAENLESTIYRYP
uniref:oxygenase MpaB family protein n=1 Tax=Kaistella sp. TaxID=2782235 RepID=UPI002F944B5A